MSEVINDQFLDSESHKHRLLIVQCWNKYLTGKQSLISSHCSSCQLLCFRKRDEVLVIILGGEKNCRWLHITLKPFFQFPHPFLCRVQRVSGLASHLPLLPPSVGAQHQRARKGRMESWSLGHSARKYASRVLLLAAGPNFTVKRGSLSEVEQENGTRVTH